VPTIVEIVTTPEIAHQYEELKLAVAVKTGNQPFFVRILKRSIDARHRSIKYNLRLEVFDSGEEVPPFITKKEYLDVRHAEKVIIAGAGPAGLFAALRCIERGLKPIVMERGKDVRERRRDLAAINKSHIVDPDSNYCFGEGGAGTYSDGKLYTRSTKRGDVRSVLETLVQFGASEDILVDAHPHIGTNKLPGIIQAIRQTILDCGGEVHFNCRLSDIILEQDKVSGFKNQHAEVFSGVGYILATGHSARDIFHLLLEKGIQIESKPFALGVRAEHPQSLIDSVQYHCDIRPDLLPAAAYNLVHQVKDRGVYSFCMCPGGIIAPCATSQNEIVTNGWSPSKRNNPFANSGIVVPVNSSDLKSFKQFGPLDGLEFQKQIEQKAWLFGGKTQVAPAQRLVDFVENRVSKDLPECSYVPGIVSVNLNELFPEFIRESLREGFRAFGKKMKGYFTNDAVLVGPESRTSSPVRIPRDAQLMHHVSISNLYPCAEGAGYAGGIVSAAIDGEKIADIICDKQRLLKV
jgi:uncharacterized FAD-dependent dehydrogenase